MIELLTANTPNGKKISIMLEEIKFNYKVTKINILKDEQFKTEFKKRKLAPKNLSRTLEDSATMTSPLVPWNTCGAFMSASLGIATFSYLPFCFFNIVNPIIAIIYALCNFKIEKV